MITKLIEKYREAIRRKNFALAYNIEMEIIEKTEKWSFQYRDKVIEALTLASI